MITSLSLNQLCQIVNGSLLEQNDALFSHICIDSRRIQPKDLFIAIRGENFDGHDFAEQAVQNGAIALLVERPLSIPTPQIVVSDTRKALAALAKYHRETYPIPLAAITGSNGKTTTKALLASILSVKGQVLYSEASFNNDIGLPLTLLNQNLQHDYAVIEMGANHPGEIAQLTQITKPEVAVITNIGPAHLEGFGDLNGVIRAKSEIFQGLQEAGVAVINGDQPEYADFFIQTLKPVNRVLRFGLSDSSGVWASHIKLNASMQPSFKLHLGKKTEMVQLNLVGAHNVMNALAAAAAAMVLGVHIQEIKQGLEEAVPVAKRLNIRSGHRHSTIIDDSYNAIPNAVLAAIDVLAEYAGPKLFAFGGMAELGNQPEKFYREVAEHAKKKGIQYFYAIGDLSKVAVEIFGQGGQHFASKAELIQAVKEWQQEDAVILVKGSRGSRMEEVVEELVVKN